MSTKRTRAVRAATGLSPLFTPEEVAAYEPQGPSRTFRHFCSAFQLVGGKTDEYLTKADPVAYAEFHQKLHADAAVLLGVPSEGYATYNSKLGPIYPNMKGDWFGQTIVELHKRSIKAFGYVTLGWNAHYLAEHPEYSSSCWYGPRSLCLNSPYLDLIIGYCEEVLTNYPVDGLRFDILDQGSECRCKSCRRLHRAWFGKAMPARWTDDRQRSEFRRRSLLLAMQRIHAACKAAKPSVEIWHNQLNLYQHNMPLEGLAYVDIAYMENGDAFGQLFHITMSGKSSVIVGKLENLPHDQMRLCTALGAHGYTYIMARHFDCLPPATEKLAQAWRVEMKWTAPGPRENARSRPETVAKLAPFYEMVSHIEPYLVNARPVYHNIGLVYCEATRLRYKDFDRTDYVCAMRGFAEAFLARSAAVEFVNSPALVGQNLRRFKVLVLPETSGLKPAELDALRRYVKQGGHLILTGEALRYDEEGWPLREPALSKEMNLGNVFNMPAAGIISKVGKGTITFIRKPTTEELVARVDSFAPALPVTVTSRKGNPVAILTQQPSKKRWVLHLIGDGNYGVTIDRRFASPTRVVEQFPAKGWNAKVAMDKRGMTIKVAGKATDRLLVLS
ncbi:MAG: alpha-amylase family protein [Phycisphaeraceae bacterium]